MSAEEQQLKAEQPEPEDAAQQKPNTILALSASAVMGLWFGFLFEKSHVYEPQAIRGQFNFEVWIMMKMFMGAVSASCVAFVGLKTLAPARFDAVRLGFHPAQRGLLAGGAVGGAILGTGMVVAGACPGMVLPQVGTGVPNALLTTLGGVVGALAFGLLEPTLRPALLAKGTQCSGSETDFIDVKLGKPFAPLCLLLGVMCGGLAVLLEVLVPYEDELCVSLNPCVRLSNSTVDNGTLFAARAWPPALCGFLLGAMQIPAAAFIHDSLGSSSSYQCVAGQCLLVAPAAAQSRFTYLDKSRKGVGSWWQVFYVGCAVLGSWLSATLSDTVPTTAEGVPVAPALIGGFLMLFGSRLGGGCTSGHGISGMPLLNSLSIVAVCAMFGAGIVVGLIMDACNVLEITPLAGRL